MAGAPGTTANRYRISTGLPMAADWVLSVTDGVAIGAALSSALEHDIAHDAMTITASRESGRCSIGSGMIPRNPCYSWAGLRARQWPQTHSAWWKQRASS